MSVTVLVMLPWLPSAISLIYSLSCLVAQSNSARRIRRHQRQYIVAMALLFMLAVSRLRVMLSG
jgi:Fe2+ transport system protein B